MIEFKDVSKEIGTFRLNHISFHLPAGFICGLVGKNGVGKTTLLHILCGLYRPDEGRVILDGKTYEEHERELHNQIGVVLNEELFDSSFSIRDNANHYGRYFSKYTWEKMETLLKQFHLDGNKKFKSLSRGEKLKCQFAFALAHNPDLLILDEPTGNFDPEFRELFFKTLREFIADGRKSVILASHLTEDLDRMADYLIYLEDGEQIFAGDIERFRDEYRMVSGEKYKINLLEKDKILHLEDGKYGAKALVKHSWSNRYDASLQVTYPSIEEFMYHYSKRDKG